MTGAAKFDPFAILGETPPAAPSSTPKSEDGSAKAAKVAKVAKVGATLAGLAALAGGKLESERAEAKHASHLTAEWTPQDWLDHFEERAAIIEHDGELPRPEAEHQAFADTVEQWLVMHPPEPTEDTAGCVHCNAGLGEDGVPVLAGGAHTWIHSRCHHAWLTERRRHAAEALHAMGIEAAEVLE